MVIGTNANFRSACLLIPAFKLRQINARCILHRLNKIIAGYRLPVVPLKIKRHAALKFFLAEQRMLHTNHFRAFFINGRGIKIIDFPVFVRTYRMRGRPGVLGKLAAAKKIDHLDALACLCPHLRRKLLVAKNSQAFFER